MNKEVIIIILIILYFVYYIDPTHDSEATIVLSKIDGKKYVVRVMPDSNKAADMLANINIANQKLLKHLKEQFPNDERTLLFDKNYNGEAISEGSNDSKYTSYSVNKGEKIVFCLRNADDSLVDFNTIFYVNIHEVSHLSTKEHQHTPLFWENMKWLLNEAVKLNLYKPEDYSKSPIEYCRIKINSNILINNNKTEINPKN